MKGKNHLVGIYRKGGGQKKISEDFRSNRRMGHNDWKPTQQAKKGIKNGNT